MYCEKFTQVTGLMKCPMIQRINLESNNELQASLDTYRVRRYKFATERRHGGTRFMGVGWLVMP